MTPAYIAFWWCSHSEFYLTHEPPSPTPPHSSTYLPGLGADDITPTPLRIRYYRPRVWYHTFYSAPFTVATVLPSATAILAYTPALNTYVPTVPWLPPPPPAPCRTFLPLPDAGG